jgi:hypothetical protein
MSKEDVRAAVQSALAKPPHARAKRHVNGADGDPRPEPLHPLAAFIRYELSTVRIPEYLIDDVMVAGNVVITGPRGIGKTTTLVPLFALCAHLCRPDHPLRPKLRRRVIYITEDLEQVQRVLYSLLHFGELIATEAEFNEWFKIVPAMRMPVEQVIEVASEFVKLAHVNRNAAGTTYATLPVVVFDTRSAIMEIEDENNNAEVSRVTAMLRQRFGALPTVTITHTPKAVSRADLAQMTTRGAGSQEADVQQVAYLFSDEATGKRYLSISGGAKKRFESDVDEVEFTAVINTVTGRDKLGDPVQMRVIHAEARAIRSAERHQASDEVQRKKDQQQETERRTKLLDTADAAWLGGNPLSKAELIAKAGGRKENTARTFDALVGENWLALVEVPPAQRANNAKKAFAIRLQEHERRQYLATGRLPVEKQVIPPPWRKPEARPDSRNSA